MSVSFDERITETVRQICRLRLGGHLRRSARKTPNELRKTFSMGSLLYQLFVFILSRL